ncbi:MAG: hypothetical protein LUD81_05570 [Clostridiales bacterium]|nr:hypothetical protein [Clostridiales bacterium]
MLRINIPTGELWNERKQEFVYTDGQTLELEHSLVSLSKWEAKWCKVFLDRERKTMEETIDYIRCMTLTENVKPEVYGNLTAANFKEINDYINADMTATYFSGTPKGRPSREKTTSELIYYWMLTLNIPIECENWHLNRRLTIIKVCSIKSQKPKKKSRREIMARNTALNAARRKQLGTRG